MECISKRRFYEPAAQPKWLGANKTAIWFAAPHEHKP
jgi:hypothetical protein